MSGYVRGLVLGLSALIGLQYSAAQGLPPQESEAMRLDEESAFSSAAWGFRHVARHDFQSAIDLVATPGFQQSAQGAGLFDAPLASPAFFSHSLSWLGNQDESSAWVGFYNIWVDALVVVRFERVAEVARAAEIVLVDSAAAETVALDGTLSDVAEELNRRIRRAERLFSRYWGQANTPSREADLRASSRIRQRLADAKNTVSAGGQEAADGSYGWHQASIDGACDACIAKWDAECDREAAKVAPKRRPKVEEARCPALGGGRRRRA